MNNETQGNRPDDYARLYREAQEASERLQLALDAGAIIGTWVWDVLADRFTVDERFARSFGLSVQACRHGSPLDLMTVSVHEEDLPQVETAIAEALERGGAYRCEYRVRHNDGAYRWIEASGRVEKDALGNPTRFPGVLLDIDARRLAEVERDQLNTLLRTFSAAVPGVVYAKDLHGRMLVANHGATRLIGKSPDFYLGKTDLEYLDDEEQARAIMATDRRIMDSGLSEQVEESVSLADGSAAVWLSTKEPLLNDRGEVIGLIGTSVDVTGRKQAEAAINELNQTLEQRIRVAINEREDIEKALRNAQKMEAVGQLTGGIAHDFNNILAGLSGSLELIQARLAQGRAGEVDKYLGVALASVKRAASLTHRLLAFSRRQTLSPRPTDVNALIVGMQALIARAVGPAVQVEVGEMSHLWTSLIDPVQLENSLLNLCLNARDSMPGGGRITIESANEWLDKTDGLDHEIEPGEYLCIAVSDTGSGMSAATVAKAFEPFFTTKPMGAGTGLGLSMVYGFARQSGGGIKIFSQEGVGTTVRLYLPRHVGVAPGILYADVSPEPAQKSQQTVLIVDDEPAIRLLVAEVLNSLGYVAIEAVDGMEGLRVLQSEVRIDLLITDVGLPGGMNGRQMADAGRNYRPELPVLFITGYAAHSVLDKSCLEPLTQVLTKPFELKALSSRITELIEA